MKGNKNPVKLKYAVLGASLLGCLLQYVLFATGIDGRGLLERGHPAAVALWCLTGAVAVMLLIFAPALKGPEEYADARPANLFAAVGCFALAAALAVTGLGQFGDFELMAELLVWALGMACAAGLLAVGICRLKGRKPQPLLSAAVCLYFALRMISCYRQLSGNPQSQEYIYFLMAHLAMMLAAYHQAAFDAKLSTHRKLWISSLSAVYLCCVALGHCDEPLLLAGCALWCAANLTNLTPRKRRVRPAMEWEQL